MAGASAAASLAELGYNVKAFCYQDSPRRAHSIAAQGGINAAKNYQNDGDSVRRLFYDTIKGGDFRAREANVYRLAQVSVNIIDQCVAQGVPVRPGIRRAAGQPVVRRRASVPHLLRAGADRPAIVAGRLPGPLPANRQRQRQNVSAHRNARPRDRQRPRQRHHCARPGQRRNFGPCGGRGRAGDGRLQQCFLPVHQRQGLQCHRHLAGLQKGAAMANPCYTQIHPTCIPVGGDYQSKLTLMSESLRNDGRVWVPKKKGDTRPARDIPEEERDYYLERKYPSFGNLAPRDISSRAAKEVCDEGRGVGPGGRGVYLDFADAIKRLGEAAVRERYGNLFDMYEKITGENAYQVPMRIYPAVHYTMGGLWVDYNLMSTIPGLFVLGEANFSDHGANRLGASALMQGLADGYFVAALHHRRLFRHGQTTQGRADQPEFKKAVDDVDAR